MPTTLYLLCHVMIYISTTLIYEPTTLFLFSVIFMWRKPGCKCHGVLHRIVLTPTASANHKSPDPAIGCHSKTSPKIKWMSQSKCLPQRVWRACNFVLCFNLLYNLSWERWSGWFRYGGGSRFPPWHRCGITSLRLQADCHTVLRLWLMKLLVALYLRRPFHSEAHWSQGLHTHKDMYNPEGNPYLSTGHSPLHPSPHYFTTSVASLPEALAVIMRSSVWLCKRSPSDLVDGRFL